MTSKYIPQNDFYCHIEIDKQTLPFISQIIGKNGSAFKAITHKAKVNFIWFHNVNLDSRNANIIEIWGPHNHLTNAVSLVKERIKKIKSVNNNVDHLL